VTTQVSKKVCLLGDFAVGKTSLVRRFVYDLFEDRYISTIGVKVSRKTLAVPRDGEIVELTMMLWDLAGREEFDRVRASYLRGASGAVLVCDLTRPQTIDNLRIYVQELQAVSPNAHLVVAANKVDLVEPCRSGSQGPPVLEPVQSAATSLGAPYYVTSAKTGEEVEAFFRHLGRRLVAQEP
jgi:small GTP-binding protein